VTRLIRVDGENFATAPVERIVSRYPGTVVTAAYAVPTPSSADQVMVAIEQGAEAAPSTARTSPGSWPHRATSAQVGAGYVRLCPELPKTATSKILKRELRAERWNTPDPLWWRPDPTPPIGSSPAPSARHSRQRWRGQLTPDAQGGVVASGARDLSGRRRGGGRRA